MDNEVQHAVDPQPSQSQVSTQKHHSHFLPILVTGIIMLAVGLSGGYFLFANKGQVQENPASEVVQISPTITVTEVSPTKISVSLTPATTGTAAKTTVTSQGAGADLAGIKYTLPQGWQGSITGGALHLAPTSGGGYLSVKVYSYNGTAGRREYYCQVSQVCVDGTTYFTDTTIGNISGYIANGLDNSGGGEEYFGSKGNKFYIISTYSPPPPTLFDSTYEQVLSSLVF